MTEDVVITIGERGLEALCDAQTYILLETFNEPLNPSAAAKKLGVPANRLHYQVKRLAEAGLLRVVSENGRQKVYQRVDTRFQCRKDTLGVVREAITAGGNALLEGLQKEFVRALEASFEAAQQGADEEADEYVLLEPSEGVPHASYQPMLGVTEVRLSREGYEKVMRVMGEALEAAKEAAGEGKICTVAFALYAGRVVPG